MANIKSQKKRNRQNVVRRDRNKTVTSDLKTAVNKVHVAADAGEPTEELVRQAQRKIDIATSKGIIHKKTADRKKSRLARLTSS
jgi:small subunit ribosomal protein S20